MRMNGRKENNLIIIENGQLTAYALDDRNTWTLGRASKEQMPDIRLHSSTVSRKHGEFQCTDGIWFYVDYNGKNGTVYKRECVSKHIGTGLNGRIKPVLLRDKDMFVFGCGEKETINYKTALGVFFQKSLGEEWRVVDTMGYEKLRFVSEDKTEDWNAPRKGLVIERDAGVAIYMGDVTYVNGDMEVVGG